MSIENILRHARNIGYATLLFVGMMIVAAFASQIGAPFWAVPSFCALYGLAAWLRPTVTFPKLSNSGTTKTFAVIALLLASVIKSAETDQKAGKDADAIIAASKTGAANAAVLLAASDENVLSALDLKSPNISTAERVRRQRVADASAAAKLRDEQRAQRADQLAQRAEQQRLTTAKVAAQKREEIKTALENKALRDRQKDGLHCLSNWNGSYRKLAEAVKRNLRNPDSFEHIETHITPETKAGEHLVIMKYRAQNGFGGMNVERAMVAIEAGSCAPKGPMM